MAKRDGFETSKVTGAPKIPKRPRHVPHLQEWKPSKHAKGRAIIMRDDYGAAYIEAPDGSWERTPWLD